MINAPQIVMKAYLNALSGIGTPIYFSVPNNQSFPYVLLDNISERGGEDILTRTKENRNATGVDVVIQIVTGGESSKGANEADNIASLILAIALPTNPTTKLDFSPIENVTAHLDSSTYTREWNDTQIIITKELTIQHLLSQP